MPWTSFLLNLPIALGAAVLWLLLAFGVSRIVKRHAVIDVFWGSGFLVVYLESLVASNAWSSNSSAPWFELSSAHAARLVALVFVAIWSLRLSGYLALRQRGAGEDPRYTRILKGAKGKNETLYALKMIYGFQMVLLFSISIPLQFLAFARHAFLPLVILGALLMAIGIGFETVADFQLRQFLANPANRGTTLRTGLWATTRHPNYFGDAVVWWGIFTIAFSTGWGALSIASPLAMTYLLTSVSGKPMLEAKLKRTREGYEEYVASTSGFFPRRPKR
jgi:steroid 5-alpha reductase family enzyme